MSKLEHERRLQDMAVIRQKLGCKADLAEVYSPPRVTEVAKELGMRQGFALDLTVPTPSGYVWDFAKRNCRRRALESIRSVKPFMVIGSPECTAYSRLQELFNMNTQEKRDDILRRRKEAEVHLRFCMLIYRIQMQGGRYFTH